MRAEFPEMTDAVEKVPNCLVTNFPLTKNGATAGGYALRPNTEVNGKLGAR